MSRRQTEAFIDKVCFRFGYAGLRPLVDVPMVCGVSVVRDTIRTLKSRNDYLLLCIDDILFAPCIQRQSDQDLGTGRF